MVKPTLTDQAYDSLNTFFTSHEASTIEIEILPSALSPPNSLTLQDGHNIGFSKSVLIQAFLKARKLFLASKENHNLEATCLEATRILILFDPEYLTAVNFRKTHLSQVLASASESSPTLGTALQHEIHFLNSILTSPLHRQTKSPTLWAYRSWIIEVLGLHKGLERRFEFEGSVVQTELWAVQRAGERHRMNYYAWGHARRMITCIIERHREENMEGDGRDRDVYVQGMLEECTTYTRQWCVKNPSDTSGWSFLAFVLRRVRERGFRVKMVKELLDWVIMLELRQESVWAFFRVVLVDPDVIGVGGKDVIGEGILENLQDEEKENEYSINNDISTDDTSTETPRTKASKWISKYSITSPRQNRHTADEAGKTTSIPNAESEHCDERPR
jgi:hypothetical protein